MKTDSPPDLAVDRPPSPDGAPDISCKPEITECGSLCGLVRDPCTGQEFQCGECEAGKICDIVTHTCLVPKITCQDLGAECGQVKNSCGKRLDCGKCPAGKECDPDSNTCIACSQVTCADLGYNCGMAWLGCGPTTNTVNCGTCLPTETCNTAYNFCEPACTPKPAKDICAAAKVAQGVECGFISDGCGGLVDCGGCPTGEQCGIFGVANRCEKIEVLDECKALGYECGKITSLCDGKKVSCGTCPKGTVCNSNHLCGPPCQPTTCADLAKQGKECGSFSDGCNGQLTCKCSDKDAICQPNNTCCVNTAACPTGKCNMTVTDTCTGQTVKCECGSGQYCETATKTCQAGKTCADYQAGGTNSKCNDHQYYDHGDGTKFACKCKSPAVCINDSATTEGTCCTNVNHCQAGKCGYTVKDSCTGATINCDCPGGQYCDNGTCKALNTCSIYGANGGAGDPCSNGPNPSWPSGNGGFLTCPCHSGYACLKNGVPVTGGTQGICVLQNTCSTYNATGKLGETCSNGPSPAFPRGDGTNLRCKCKGGRVCAKNGALVTGGDTGTCIYKNTCSTYSATGKAGEVCSNAKSSAFPNGVGGTLKCGCGSGLVCADGSNNIVSGNTTGTCKYKKTCADYNADGSVGAPCNDSSYFDNGFGGKFKCKCTTTGGFANATCVGDSPTKAGTCQCTSRACTCDITGKSDGCGGTLSCACSGSTPLCNTSAKQCCPDYTCSALPPGIAAGSCGTIPDPCMGGTFNCGCSTSGGMTNNTCVLQSGKTYGSCQCTPSTCAQLGTGTWPDGCGGTITCSG
ncbi:MAG: hypothetical protein CSA65_06850 [Proteobacteria bacterium]|nr:MAG: hypothetical protein CSA65_06850 [Pseudomonadota bacterium]